MNQSYLGPGEQKLINSCSPGPRVTLVHDSYFWALILTLSLCVVGRCENLRNHALRACPHAGPWSFLHHRGRRPRIGSGTKLVSRSSTDHASETWTLLQWNNASLQLTFRRLPRSWDVTSSVLGWQWREEDPMRAPFSSMQCLSSAGGVAGEACGLQPSEP